MNPCMYTNLYKVNGELFSCDITVLRVPSREGNIKNGIISSLIFGVSKFVQNLTVGF